MEAVFVTERIILLSAPENTTDSAYRPAVKEISSQLSLDYGPQHYLIINVSEPRSDLIRLNNSHVMDYGWAATLAPPLERLCAICKQADVWMNTDPRNILIIHCKGGLGRAAIVVASYMHYTSICATPNQALDRYAMKHFFDDELKRHILPSQRRYVQYFSGLLSGSIAMNSDPVYLCTISLIQVPNFDGKAGCRPFFKVYQNNEHIWTSEVYSMSESEERRILTIHLRPSLQLRGDIMVKAYHHKKLRPDLKDIIFRCQLHTCALQDGLFVLNKGDLDEANNDIRFRDDGRLQLSFSHSASDTSITAPPIFDAQSSDHRPVDQVGPTAQSHPVFLHPALEIANHLSLGWNESFNGDTSLHPESSGESARATGEGYFHFSSPVQSSSPSWQHKLTSEEVVSSPYDPRVTYAKVQKKASTSAAGRRKPVRPDPGPAASYPSGGSLDSGINTTAANYIPTEMDRRSPSPGGTAKSVKFRDVPDGPGSSSYATSVPVAQRGANGPTSLRSGMEVVDLDAIQPDMDELDRVFESLQADTEDLEQKLSSSSSSSISQKDKEIKAASPSLARAEPKYQTDPRRLLENETGTGLRNGVTPPPPQSAYAGPIDQGDSTFESETDTASSVTGQDGNFISSYVPQDRKGLGKKYGAFTFGLPTTRPELKSISSPPPKRRDSREPPSFSSDHEQSESELYGRARLRHVNNETPAAQRQRAEERLYNTSAPSPSPTRQQSSATSDVNRRADPPLQHSNSVDTTGTYGKIQARQPPRTVSPHTQSLPRRVPSPTPPRPKTPTEEERLLRLLSTEKREFLVEDSGPQDRYKSRLKEIAREGLSDEEEERLRHARGTVSDFSHHDVSMPSSNVHTDGEDSPLPERKKKKKATAVQTQSEPTTRMDASSWLQMQHDKLMTRKYGPEYTRRKDKEAALLEELRSSQERMIEQVPNRELDENRLPLSSIILREAKTPPLVRRAGDDDMDGSSPRDNPGYAVVRSQLTRGPAGHSSKRETLTRHQSPSATSYVERPVETYSSSRNGAAGNGEIDTDHDSITDEIDFGDEPLYKSPASYRLSRSREMDESRLRSAGGGGGAGSFSNPTSPDQLRRAAAASPKSILKNSSLPRGRQATSEDRGGGNSSNDRAITPNFLQSPEKERSASLARNTSIQRGYSVYGTRERVSGGTNNTNDMKSANMSGRSTPTGYFGMSNSRRSSLTSVNQAEGPEEIYVSHENPTFVRDLSKLWYKPGITREEAIQILKDKPPGTFLIRDSNSFPGAFGLAVKVDADQISNGHENKEDLVRHFLIEPSAKGVHLKGCQNEPVFASLSALVYQHSVTALALPCRLLLPESDMTLSHQPLYSEDNLQRLMDQGAACNVFYLLSMDTESLTGPQAIRRAMTHVQHGHPIQPTVVHFKVNAQGIILTDNKRRLFFRRHYPIQTVSFCGLDPDDRRWTFKADEKSAPSSARCFGFVSRKGGSYNQNECHLFAELETEQPAGAVVSFVTKVMMTSTSIAERRSHVAHSHAVDQKAAGPFTSLDSMTLTRSAHGHGRPN